MAMNMAMGMDAKRPKGLSAMRRSSRRHSQRSLREWALRGGLALAATIAGYVSTTQTLAFVLGKSNAERAHAMAPGDGRLAGMLAEKQAAAEQAPAARAATASLARHALAVEPLAASALTALALTTQLDGNTPKARALFVHSDALSRRELGTRLWLIEDAVARNDVADALRHYDIALRTSKNASELLFPILVQAANDPAVATALTNTLKTGPAWRDDFLTYFGGLGPNPLQTAAFFRRLAGARVPIPEVARITVVNALAKDRQYRESWDYYRSLRPGVDPGRLRDPEFKAALQTPSIFDWMPVVEDAGVSAEIADGAFDFSAPSTVGGVVLQQIQILPAGRYRLQGTFSGIKETAETTPYWQLSCMDGRDLGRVALPSTDSDEGSFAGELTVTASCPVQNLRFIVRPSSNTSGVVGRIDRALLVPVGTAG